MNKWIKTLLLGAMMLIGTNLIQADTHEVDGVIGDYFTQDDGSYLVACELDDGDDSIHWYTTKEKPESDYISVLIEGNQIWEVWYRR